jgi:hypothetical protein
MRGVYEDCGIGNDEVEEAPRGFQEGMELGSWKIAG